jgi:hypothetical protein
LPDVVPVASVPVDFDGVPNVIVRDVVPVVVITSLATCPFVPLAGVTVQLEAGVKRNTLPKLQFITTVLADIKTDLPPAIKVSAVNSPVQFNCGVEIAILFF